MFDKDHRRFIRKKDAWPLVTRGILMRLYFDTETYGFDQNHDAYTTPAWPALAEYGFGLLDISFNYLESGQIFPRRPDGLYIQPSAAILQRMRNGPKDLDDPARPNYFQAMGSIAWHIQQAKKSYGKFGDRPIRRPILDFNLQFAERVKEGTEWVIPVPLIDEKGEICYDVRWHPQREMVSYRFDNDARSPYYWGGDNLYYVDESDQSTWKWVNPSLLIAGYNIRYDLPLMMSNLSRAGFDPRDTTMLYSSASPTDSQQPANYLFDVRHSVYSGAIYGRQDENGIKLGELIDPVTERIRTSEALARVLEANTSHHNVMRFISDGAFMPHDASKHDAALDHGAAYDALGTAAIDSLAWYANPEISSLVTMQSGEKDRLNYLNAHSYDDQNPDIENLKKLPVFSLARRQSGHDHSEQPYWHVGNDSQAGDFKNQIFLLTDGNLHQIKFKNKFLHELTTDEWVLYYEDMKGDPDRPVRLEKIRYMPPAIHISTVMKETSQAKNYRTHLRDIMKDTAYIMEHPEMVERIIHALADINHDRRFDNPIPQIPFPEDERPARYARGVAYQQEAIKLERQRAKRRGPQIIPGPIEMLKNKMDNTYNFAENMDRAGRMLCLRGHEIDDHRGEFATLGTEAYNALVSFTTLCNKQYELYYKKKCPYTKVLESITRDDGEPYFVEGKRGGRPKFKVYTIDDALDFRRKLGLRALNDYLTEVKRKHSPYIDGFVDKDFCRHIVKRDGKDMPLFLFADADNGEKGAAPHIVDEHGRELPLAYLLSIPKSDLHHMTIDTDKWYCRLYRRRFDQTIYHLMNRFIQFDDGDLIPPLLRQMYDADMQKRDHGFLNETITTARAPNLHTLALEVKRLKAASTARIPTSQERDPNPHLTQAALTLKYDESSRILAATDSYIQKRLTEHPPRNDLWHIGGYEPETEMPYDDIRFQIDRDKNLPLTEDPNFVTIDLPLRHVHDVPEQFDISLPRKGWVIPAPDRKTRDAIRRGKPVVVHVPETGQLYTPGIATIHPIIKKDFARYANILTRARSDYGADDKDPRFAERVFYMGGECLQDLKDPYLIANSRQIDHKAQSIKLPFVQFYGLVAPQFVTMGNTPLTSVVMPVDYLPQDLTIDEPILLREMKARSWEHMKGAQTEVTGQLYETTLRHIEGESRGPNEERGITIDELYQKVKDDPEIQKRIADAGIMGPDHLRQLTDSWVTEKWKANPGQQRVMLLSFDPVSPDSWGMHHMTDAPMAAFRDNNRPVPPSAYRALHA